MQDNLNCIAVDDEPLALKLISSFVERTPFLNLQGSYLSPTDALAALRPDTDLIFLDINMAELSGLELARMLPAGVHVVFTTAYREFALDSYAVHAADYLLKPLTYPRFLETVTRIRELRAPSGLRPRPDDADQPADTPDYIFVKNDYRFVRIDLSDILYLKGLKDYVSIYLRDRKTPIIASTTMKAIEERLPQPRFCRVHKSFIVAMGAIEVVERSRIMIDKEIIPVSDAYRNHFFSLLE